MEGDNSTVKDSNFENNTAVNGGGLIIDGDKTIPVSFETHFMKGET